MKLTDSVYTNSDKIISGRNLTITYSGKLYSFYEKDFSDKEKKKVFFYYGYGNKWNEIKQKEMKKTDLGYTININVKEYNSLNFLFKDNKGNWDTNNGDAYIFKIDKLTEIQKEKLEHKSYLPSKKEKTNFIEILFNNIKKLFTGRIYNPDY